MAKGIISVILANGTALVPLLVLTLSVLSSRLTSELMAANKLILSVAGVVALPAILDD